MKTIEDLEKEKLEEEIKILRARIKNEFPEHKPKGWFDKVSDFFRRWYSVVLAIIAVAGGFWGIFYPVKTFLNERQKAVQYDINENMINALEGLEKDDKIAKENSIIILSYYDLNAIPILLNKYIESDYLDQDLQLEYMDAISMIYKRKNTEIIDRIIKKMRINYSLFDKYISQNDWKYNKASENLIKLINLIKYMNPDLLSWDIVKMKNFYTEIVAHMNENTNLKSNEDVEVLKTKIEDFINNGK